MRNKCDLNLLIEKSVQNLSGFLKKKRLLTKNG